MKNIIHKKGKRNAPADKSDSEEFIVKDPEEGTSQAGVSMMAWRLRKMKVGSVREIKNNEFRVGMIPDNVKSYVNAGHDVYIEKGAGAGSGFTDAEYEAAGAKLLDTAKEVWDTVEMMVKVKEPLPDEYPLFHEGLILYTYLHLAADQPQTDALLNAKVKGVAYETLMDRNGGLPLLAPMSQIAGRLSVQEGAKYLEKACFLRECRERRKRMW